MISVPRFHGVKHVVICQERKRWSLVLETGNSQQQVPVAKTKQLCLKIPRSYRIIRCCKIALNVKPLKCYSSFDWG